MIGQTFFSKQRNLFVLMTAVFGFISAAATARTPQPESHNYEIFPVLIKPKVHDPEGPEFVAYIVRPTDGPSRLFAVGKNSKIPREIVLEGEKAQKIAHLLLEKTQRHVIKRYLDRGALSDKKRGTPSEPEKPNTENDFEKQFKDKEGFNDGQSSYVILTDDGDPDKILGTLRVSSRGLAPAPVDLPMVERQKENGLSYNYPTAKHLRLFFTEVPQMRTDRIFPSHYSVDSRSAAFVNIAYGDSVELKAWTYNEEHEYDFLPLTLNLAETWELLTRGRKLTDKEKEGIKKQPIETPPEVLISEFPTWKTFDQKIKTRNRIDKSYHDGELPPHQQFVISLSNDPFEGEGINTLEWAHFGFHHREHGDKVFDPKTGYPLSFYGKNSQISVGLGITFDTYLGNFATASIPEVEDLDYVFPSEYLIESDRPRQRLYENEDRGYGFETFQTFQDPVAKRKYAWMRMSRPKLLTQFLHNWTFGYEKFRGPKNDFKPLPEEFDGVRNLIGTMNLLKDRGLIDESDYWDWYSGWMDGEGLRYGEYYRQREDNQTVFSEADLIGRSNIHQTSNIGLVSRTRCVGLLFYLDRPSKVPK